MAQVNYTKHSIIPPRVRTRIHACLHVHVHVYASTFGVRDKGRFEPGGMLRTRDRLGRMIPFVRKKKKENEKIVAQRLLYVGEE